MKKLFFLVVMISGSLQTSWAQHLSGSELPFASASRPVKMTEEEKVNYLINFIRNLHGAIFIRNGKEYPPEKAADHLLSKWNKHKKKVKTAKGFVERLATVSKSDEPYLIKYADGNTIKCGELLSTELAKIEK